MADSITIGSSMKSCAVTYPGGCPTYPDTIENMVFEGPIGARGTSGSSGTASTVSAQSTVSVNAHSSTNEIANKPADGTPGDIVIWTDTTGGGNAKSLLVWNGITDEWVYASDGLDAFTV